MAIKVASNGSNLNFMPIIYPNYLLMAISFELIMVFFICDCVLRRIQLGQ